ncbi:hypothetical protein DYB30_004656 [Aphanomyces astaci]|uniref:Uncharacterized protein n=2 Tax=Aphanomyces astaci TaxID=112090 RepID=A0A397EPW5_APHAT|nr:hypothetical protein DYB30_004656 [Aphanomyces astaci]RHY95519.1 hypothetical protein DYB31_001997 [Aphanomyces astaci]
MIGWATPNCHKMSTDVQAAVARPDCTHRANFDHSDAESSHIDQATCIDLTEDDGTAALPAFLWQDKTVRRVPEGWEFPAYPMDEMWFMWFLGDVDDDFRVISPFRLLSSDDFDDAESQLRLATTQQRMSQLMEVLPTITERVTTGDDLAALARKDVATFEALYTRACHGACGPPLRDMSCQEAGLSALSYQIVHNTMQWLSYLASLSPFWLRWFHPISRSMAYGRRRAWEASAVSTDRLHHAQTIVDALVAIAIEYRYTSSVGDLEAKTDAQLMEILSDVFATFQSRCLIKRRGRRPSINSKVTALYFAMKREDARPPKRRMLSDGSDDS